MQVVLVISTQSSDCTCSQTIKVYFQFALILKTKMAYDLMTDSIYTVSHHNLLLLGHFISINSVRNNNNLNSDYKREQQFNLSPREVAMD